MIFKEYLKESATHIDKHLQSFFQQWKSEVDKIDKHLIPLIDAVIESNKGGKKIRGTLVRLGYELYKNLNHEIFLPAAAYEIFQTAILAHDDIIDKSQLRRGKATLYASLGGDHYAISQSICLGDTGFFLAIQILSNTHFEAENKVQAISAFTNAMVETALGEMLDVEIPSKKIQLSENTIMQIYKYKTARYSLVGPLQMGAHLAGASKSDLEKLKQFGDALGIAYQIQDDILGVFGTEEELGKPITCDVEEGKATILLAYAEQIASPSQKKDLKKLYGKGRISAKDFEKIRQIFLQTNSLDQAQAKAVQYVAEAKKMISKITKNIEHQQLLYQLADLLIERKK